MTPTIFIRNNDDVSTSPNFKMFNDHKSWWLLYNLTIKYIVPSKFFFYCYLYFAHLNVDGFISIKKNHQDSLRIFFFFFLFAIISFIWTITLSLMRCGAYTQSCIIGLLTFWLIIRLVRLWSIFTFLWCRT